MEAVIFCNVKQKTSGDFTRLSKYGIKKKPRYSEVRDALALQVQTEYAEAKIRTLDILKKINYFGYWWDIVSAQVAKYTNRYYFP